MKTKALTVQIIIILNQIVLFVIAALYYNDYFNNFLFMYLHIMSVRVTFDGNLFHPAEGLFKKVLPIYYTVIVWGRFVPGSIC